MKVRKRAERFDAEQFLVEREPWPAGVVETVPSVGHDGPHTSHCQWAFTYRMPAVDIRPGDWVVTDRDGRKWVVRPDLFAEAYEAAE